MDAQVLIKGVSEMPISEMERFVQAINALITQKKTTDKSYREPNTLLDFAHCL